MSDDYKTLASIDVGTNTFRLLIAEADGNGIMEIYSERIITRIGEGVSLDGLLKKEAIARGIGALKRFAGVISRYRIDALSAVATSAMREARNREDFLKKAKDEAGIDVRIISGEEEARKTFLGMITGIPVSDTALTVDIGGGSTEIIAAKNTEPLYLKSLPYGVVYLTDKYMKHDPPAKKDIMLMGEEISDGIRTVYKGIANLLTPETVLIGTAGTVTTLAAMVQGLKSFDRDRIHNFKISIDLVKEIFSDISVISSKERAKYSALEPARFDIIVPGTLILLGLMEAFEFKEIIVSDYGLKEGVIIDLYQSIEVS
ncbi:MAG: Ppx/GppA family phosphatase [Nitrospirae bacterium]|nr:Ppx/GppA family phosphatase [Nitrospirota bacterium]